MEKRDAVRPSDGQQEAGEGTTAPQVPGRGKGSQRGGTSNHPGNANESGSAGSTRRDDGASIEDRVP